MPNSFAYASLILWPLISFAFYTRFPILTATFLTIVGGYMLLPVNTVIDFPLVPPFNKESIVALTAFIGCKFIKKVNISPVPRHGLEKWLIIILLITPLITMLNNQETYNRGDIIISGLTFHDAFSSTINQYIGLLPFIILVQLVKTYEDQLHLFKLLVIGCLFYSILILFEIRMSPQLHTMFYGYFPHESFGQAMRYGGFRAVVFMGHGLLVSMFVAISLGAAIILWKAKIKIYAIPTLFIIAYFMLVLVLSKTVGSFLFGLILLFSLILLPIRMIKYISIFLLTLVMLYPFLSIFELFPHQAILDFIYDYDAVRGQSLGFRFYHEGRLLEHAQDKLFFGWGEWGRNRLANSVTDGYWIIQFGVSGFVGFVALFGLAVLSAWRGIIVYPLLETKQQQYLLIAHVLIVSVMLFDQIPNASMSSWMWLYIGALLGRANYIYRKNKKIAPNMKRHGSLKYHRKKRFTRKRMLINDRKDQKINR